MSEDKVVPEKANLMSLDIGERNRAQLKQMFPTVFTESMNDKGELIESIDFEKLKAELGTFSDVFEARRERYGMDWPGKKDCMKLIQKPSIATLKPCREESVNFDETKNMFIEGDNLEVLKLLQKSYYGKIKMIYIDPPYNTGKEFIYPDDYSESLDTYLSYAGLINDEGKIFSTNTPNEGRYHTKWLNMMYPRLYLARNLLRSDGSIFISIDDNEVTNLRLLCNDVFGEENFVANIVWQKKTSSDARMVISSAHDHIIVYAKSRELLNLNSLPMTDERKKSYSNPDNDPRGPWASVDLTGQTGRAPKSQFYKIRTPSGIEMPPPDGRCWALAETTFNELRDDNRIWFGKDGDNRPRLKKFLSEAEGVRPWTWWDNKTVGHNQEGNQEVKELFDGQVVFDNPKPVRLLQRIVELTSKSSEQNIILDFFAGSATLAHATLAQNQCDGGDRKFILVQLPEPVATDTNDFKSASVALKLGYSTVADIAKERIRRAIQRIESDQFKRVEGIKSDLLKSREKQPKQDLGFRVLKLDKSNFAVWDSSKLDEEVEKVAKQLEVFVEHIDPKATQESILFELLMKSGFKPTEKVEKREFAGKKVFSIAEGMLQICLEDEITKELIEAVAEVEPLQFICLDRGFKGNDQLKANAVQTFAARNQGRERSDQIVFRTV